MVRLNCISSPRSGCLKVWDKKWFGRVTLDLDSSVKTVYGNQEGANVGYNPHKKGKKSYHLTVSKVMILG